MFSKSILGIGFVATISAMVFAWRSFRSAQAAEVALGEQGRQFRSTVDSVAAERNDLARKKSDVAALKAKLKNSATAKAEPAARPAAAVIPDLDIAIDSNPTLRRLYLNDFRAGLEMKYRLMYHRLGLSPEQIAAFESLAVAHEDDLVTLRAAAKAEGFRLPQTNAPGGPKNASFNTAGSDVSAGLTGLIQQSDEQFQAGIAREIGAEVAAEVARANRIADVQTFVAEMDSRRITGDPPLTLTQAAQLAELLLDASPAFRNGGSATLLDIDWNRVNEGARRVLSPTQQKILKVRSDFYQLGQTIRYYRAGAR